MRTIRITLLLSVVTLCALLAHPALGQLTDTLRVVGFSIADGSVGVALETEVAITFNHAVDPDYVVDVIGPLPEEQIEITSVDALADGKTLVFTVEHQPNTDYIWGAFGYYEAYDGDGEITVSMLVEPFISHYTTASTIGSLSVSGHVVEAELEVIGKRSVPQVAPQLPPRVEQLVRAHVRQRAAVSESVMPQRLTSSMVSQASFDQTMVFMLDSSYFGEEVEADVIPRAGTVTIDEEDGAYTVRYLRDGIVWPFALRIGAPNSLFEMVQYGFYDPDEDGEPDSLVLDGQSVTGIDITMFELSFFMYDQVAARAVADAQVGGTGEIPPLVGLTADEVQADGKAAWWTFYYQDAEDNVTEVAVFGIGDVVEVVSYGQVGFESEPIEDTYVAMAEALEVARQNGGAAYEAELDYFSLSALGGSLAQEMGGIGDMFALPTSTNPYWTFFYLGFDADAEFGVTYMALFVDMVTGSFLGSDMPLDAEENVQPERLQLSGGYPNPFREAVAFTLHLETPGHVRAAAYDVLGREVHVLIDGVLASDAQTLRWDASSMPAGIYFVRVEAGGQMTTQPVVLQR